MKRYADFEGARSPARISGIVCRIALLVAVGFNISGRCSRISGDFFSLVSLLVGLALVSRAIGIKHPAQCMTSTRSGLNGLIPIYNIYLALPAGNDAHQIGSVRNRAKL